MTQQYIAFLRGINIGGRTIKMADLKKSFEDLGFKNVKTILASGNVIFEADQESDLANKIELGLKKAFDFKIDVMIRTVQQLEDLVESDPFKGSKITPETRLYVTFLEDTEICTTLTLTQGQGTVDLMKSLEQKYGKNITTRNWNTVLKLVNNK